MKRKVKKAIPMILLVAVLMVLAACGGKSNSATGTTVPDPVLTDVQEPSGNAVDSAVVPSGETAGSEISETVEPEPVVEPIVEPEPEDPYAVLEVSEAEARAGNYGMYLCRNGKMYSLTGRGQAKIRTLYREALQGEGYVSIGDIPVMTLEEGDKIISFGFTGARFFKCEFVGNSLRMGQHGRPERYAWFFYDENGRDDGDAYGRTNLEVRDENGNLVENYNDVERGKTYTVSWFENSTNYHEIQMVADCYCYRWLEETKTEIVGTLSKESYAEYDLSELEPGIWVSPSVGLFIVP